MKRLVYILIPVLAVLLMSHNTFAGAGKYDPYTCWNIAGQGVQCSQYPISTGDEITVISIAKSNNTDLTDFHTTGHYFVWALRFTSTNALNINLGNGYAQMYDLIDLQQDCNEENGRVVCNVLVIGRLKFDNYNLQLAGRVSSYGSIYEAWSVYFGAQSDYQGFYTLYNYLVQHPSASAQDIANAVNGQQQTAGETQSQAGDTAASDSEQAVEGATQSLFSGMATVISALRDTPASDCLITVSSVGSSQVFTSAIGQLNVCSVPSGILAIVQGLAALVIVPMVLMACYSLLHKIYNAFKEVQDT